MLATIRRNELSPVRTVVDVSRSFADRERPGRVSRHVAKELNVMGIRLKRIYEPSTPSDGYRILVDRIWPRGVSKSRAAINDWAKDIAPSPELRKWFNHVPQRWDEFCARYRRELEAHASELGEIRAKAKRRTVTLLFAAKDHEQNQAVVLKQTLEGDTRLRR